MAFLSPSDLQTPGGDIARNLKNWTGLTILNGDGTQPQKARQLIDEAVGPCAWPPWACFATFEGATSARTQFFKIPSNIRAQHLLNLNGNAIRCPVFSLISFLLLSQRARLDTACR